MSDSHGIVVVDDDPGVLALCRRLLERDGHEVEVTDSPRRALELVRKRPVAVLLTDLEMPEMDGLDLLRAVKACAPTVEVIVITGHGTVRHAIEAMREGALDFLTKPFDHEELRISVEKALERHALASEVRSLRRELGERFRVGALVGRSGAMRALFERVTAFAGADVTVLLSGESGTGKEVVARALHSESRRAEAPFVAVNCGAIVEEIFESELFGHVRGAFTGAQSDKLGYIRAAQGGTLFLDEITETPPAMQVKLLRVLQEREVVPVGSTKPIPVDVRLIAASNQDIHAAVADGTLRQDLYYRINVVELGVPPLRARLDDVPLLAQHFVERFATRLGRPAPGLSAGAVSALMAHGWPGNVRELENVVEYAVALAGSGPIGVEHLPGSVTGAGVQVGGAGDGAGDGAAAATAGGFPSLAQLERAHIERALSETDGNRARAAALLGIDPKTLYRKLRGYEQPCSDAPAP